MTGKRTRYSADFKARVALDVEPLAEGDLVELVEHGLVEPLDAHIPGRPLLDGATVRPSGHGALGARKCEQADP
jgi:hypothetical protein